ncbi:HD domain-containing protein [soil metagenome]
MTLTSIDDLRRLFAARGAEQYSGEPVSQLEHALQTAERARAAGASPALAVSALLHDVGHLLEDLGDTPTLRGIDDSHEARGAAALSAMFGPAVVEPMRLHVAAKRHLVATEPGYRARLSQDSVRSLALQGGAFSVAQSARFMSQPYAADAVALRRWDEAAKVEGQATASLDDWLTIAAGLVR